MMDGLFLIDKTSDCTSHDVVQSVRRIIHQRKVGHCGTLDPGATGLLLVTAGRATRLTRFLIRAPKAYAGQIRFGITTDTYDRHGQVIAEEPCDSLDLASVRAAMEDLVGTYEQAAPPFSAKKHQGVKYYEMARRGEEVPEATKQVTVFEFRADSASVEGDRIDFFLSCSSGTYVRSVAHELGKALGCGAHLTELRRLTVGPFQIEDAVSLADLSDAVEAQTETLPGFIPLSRIPLPFAELTLDTQQEQRVLHGQSILFRQLEGEAGDWVKLADRRGQLVAVGVISEKIGQGGVGLVQPRIVFL